MSLNWRRIEPTEVTKIGWRTVVTKNFILPDGSKQEFQTYDVEGRHYAAVVALTPDKQVVTIRQFRPGPEKLFYDVPGGIVDSEDNGDYALAAGRELLEETGYQAASLTALGLVYKDPYNNATWHYFLGLDCQQVSGQQLEASEFGEVVLLPVANFLTKAKTGEVSDTEAVFLAYDHLLKLK